MTDLRKLNQSIMDDVKRDGTSYGMRLLLDAIRATQAGKPKTRLVIYMMRVTSKRLKAFIIHEGALHRLCVPEAGHRLYQDYSDGYQYTGGGYSSEVALLDRLHAEASKHMTVDLVPQGTFGYERI